MLYTNDTNHAFEGMPPIQPNEPGRHDILGVLWRWKWLPIVGAAMGMVVGVLNFSRQKPIFESNALIQVVYPNAETPGLEPVASGPDTVRGQSRLDESRIIMSERVIDMAIQLNDLSSHPKLSSMSAAELRSWIKSPSHLSVEPAGRDASTALIEIRFKGTDAEVCQVVIDAIIAGYDRYLSEAYRKLGDEVVEVVTKAQDQLQKKYEEIAKKNAEFRQNAPLVWLGDEGNNHFSEHCIEIKKSINEIEIEDLKLQSLVAHIQAVESKGRPAESILQMLSSDPQLNSILFRQADPAQANAALGGRSLGSTTADRRATLVDLQIKEQELLNSVGEGHPAVASTRLRIELLNKQIVAMSDAEKQEMNIYQGGQGDPSTKLAFWKSAIQDRMAALKIQRGSLQALADDNERKSKELGEYLSQHSLLNKELASAQLLLDNYTNTLNRIQILPQGSQLTLQTLTPPAMGVFVSPTIAPYLLGGAAGGFLLLAGLAILLDFADKNFRSPDEITRALGFPVLGHVPQLKEQPRKNMLSPVDATLCTLGGPNAFGSEAFRSIRTNLYFRDAETENRVIQITSPVPGDGKSTVATNLAVSIAQSGRTVLLIDADMRRPRISSLFGQRSEIGLADLLRNECELSDVMLDGPISNLTLIASSVPAKNPAELLSSVTFNSLIETLRTKFDYIIIDTPPLLAVSDAASVAARVDAVLLTVRLRRNSKPLALQAAQILLDMGVRPMGIVVNGITNSRKYEYRYGKYGYQDAVVE
jgi:polysaccharide biosynthesis transport protein